jgi:hypothetical protein
MRAVVALVALVAFAALSAAGCGGGGDVASAEMALSPSSGLSPSDVAAVEILVFDGANAGCARVMTGASPLDDAGLVLVAHALFTIDGTPKHLAIPAGKPLDFYAEAFRTAAPSRTRIGRGCVGQTLAAGGPATVSIGISATDP